MNSLNLYFIAFIVINCFFDNAICDYIERDIVNNIENYETLRFNRRQQFKGNEYFDKDYGYSYIGNPDDFAEIERPCPVYDLHCIRRFFAAHSKCKIANGPLPDPFYRTQYSVYVTNGNATGSPTSVVINGLPNARVEEFYINRATNNLVIAINFRNLTISPRSTYFRFYRKGREPITRVGNTFIQYPSLTGTAVIPNIHDLELDKAEVTGYSDDAVPPFIFGPTIPDPTDPTVTGTFAAILADVPTAVQEVLLTEAPYFPPAYIQFNICDFGLKLL